MKTSSVIFRTILITPALLVFTLFCSGARLSVKEQGKCLQKALEKALPGRAGDCFSAGEPVYAVIANTEGELYREYLIKTLRFRLPGHGIVPLSNDSLKALIGTAGKGGIPVNAVVVAFNKPGRSVTISGYIYSKQKNEIKQFGNTAELRNRQPGLDAILAAFGVAVVLLWFIGSRAGVITAS